MKIHKTEGSLIGLVKNVRQYGKVASPEEMKQLMDIAKDYAVVKNYVYRRYSGIRSISKLHPVYEIQNEMTASGLRQELGLPSVYFYPAVFDAIADIKAGWTRVKTLIAKHAMANENFTADEKHYVCYALKNDDMFGDILLRRENESRETFTGPLSAGRADVLEKVSEKSSALNNYIRRQVRKYQPFHQAKKAESFSVTVKGYLYDHGTIRLTTKVKRKRVVIPLTDKNEYHHQLGISLLPESRQIVINIPVETKIRSHPDYTEEIGIALGYETMFTVSTGNRYGADYGMKRTAQMLELDRMNANRKRMTALYHKYMKEGNLVKAENIEKNNLGRQKYDSYKRRSEAELKAYINSEIDQMLKKERPSVIYLPKLPQSTAVQCKWAGAANRKFSSWQRGYIRKRLTYKCMANDIKLVLVFGKDISKQCNLCGKSGVKDEGYFVCSTCGMRIEERTNAARNALNRAMETKKED